MDCVSSGRAPAPAASRLEAVAAWLFRPGVFLRIGAALIAALYLRTIAFGLVYDDFSILVFPYNGFWNDVREVFRHDIFGFGGTPGSAYYRPLASLWGILVHYATGGMAGWFHLGAIFLHLIVFYLSFVFSRMLFRENRLALVTALLYALHPVKVESVAWIGASGCDVLGAIFFFGVLICYFKWRQQNAIAWLACSWIWFGAAMFTKETLVAAAMLVVCHYWMTIPAHQRIRKSSLLTLPYAIVLMAHMAVRHMVLGTPPANAPYIQPTLGMEAFWTAPLACWWYLKHLVLPTGLGLMYDSIVVRGPSLGKFLLPAVCLAALAVAGWIFHFRRSVNAKFLAVWFGLALGPYVVFLPLVQLHDRYLYLASYPFCALVARALVRPHDSGSKQGRRFLVGIILTGLWAASVWHESFFWRDEVTVCERAVEIAPSDGRSHRLLAQVYLDAGNFTQSVRVLDEALRTHPGSPTLWQMRGAALQRQGQDAEAGKSFLKVMEVAEGTHEKPWAVLVSKSVAAFQLGKLEMKQGNHASAERWLRTAISLQPENIAYHLALAQALGKQGRSNEADAELAIVQADLQRQMRERKNQSRP